jgi:hypothetical protein
VFLLGLLLQTALADQVEYVGPARDAEIVRLRDELGLLARKSAWVGVERTYREMVLLDPASLDAMDHWTAAQAAAVSGDTAAVCDRLKAALATGDAPDEARPWLAAMARRYGRVSLVGASLEPVAQPFAPDEGASVRFASDHLEGTGQFDGLLPAGKYRVDGEIVVVRATRR